MEKAPRQPMPARDPVERSKNFLEVAVGYDEETALLEASRCLNCKKPLCVSGCPVEVLIPEFITLLKEKKYVEAARKIKEKNNLPAICGRVCPQETQCEARCVLKKKFGSVAIGRLERFAADYEIEKGVEKPELSPRIGKKIAVVGAGPAGLTVAGDLARFGYDVEIFEALHAPGGVLKYGIPPFRLPRKVLNAEIAYVESLGVKIHVDVVVGKSITIDELFEEGFSAVFVGIGAGYPLFMGIPGENLIGVVSANEFLTRVNLMMAYEFPKYDTPIRIPKRVAVVGAGNVAMDSARTSKRLGAEEVFIVYRRSREEMPARAEEVEHAEEEGIEFKLLTSPVRIFANEEGHVKAIECIKMELGEPDESGRRRPVPVKGSEFIIDVGLVIMAIGTGANPLIAQTTPGLEINKKGYIVTFNESGQTSRPLVYAGGDIVTGSATVIEAMGAGKQAAKAIHQILSEKVAVESSK